MLLLQSTTTAKKKKESENFHDELSKDANKCCALFPVDVDHDDKELFFLTFLCWGVFGI